jgi:hypothetical protein
MLWTAPPRALEVAWPRCEADLSAGARWRGWRAKTHTMLKVAAIVALTAGAVMCFGMAVIGMIVLRMANDAGDKWWTQYLSIPCWPCLAVLRCSRFVGPTNSDVPCLVSTDAIGRRTFLATARRGVKTSPLFARPPEGGGLRAVVADVPLLDYILRWHIPGESISHPDCRAASILIVAVHGTTQRATRKAPSRDPASLAGHLLDRQASCPQLPGQWAFRWRGLRGTGSQRR